VINFYKYHGCGNSFVIVMHEEVKKYNQKNLAKYVCDEEDGIGADGCIIVKIHPLEMIVYSKEGTKVAICGNALRCFAKFVVDHTFVTTTTFDVKVDTTIVSVSYSQGFSEVNMGTPIFDKQLLHIDEELNIEDFKLHGFSISALFIGSIQSVVFVDSLNDMDVAIVGIAISNDKIFKEKTNVNFVEIIDRNNIHVIPYHRENKLSNVYDYGCCASFVYAYKKGFINEEVNAHLEFGSLHLRYQDNKIMIKGAATIIAEGKIDMKEVKLC